MCDFRKLSGLKSKLDRLESVLKDQGTMYVPDVRARIRACYVMKQSIYV